MAPGNIINKFRSAIEPRKENEDAKKFIDAQQTDPKKNDAEEISSEEPSQELGSKKENAEPSQELESKKENADPSQELGSKKENTHPSQELGSQKENTDPSRELRSKKENADPSQELGSKKENTDPSQGLGSKKENAEPSQELESKKENAEPSQELGSKKENTEPSQELESKKDNADSTKCMQQTDLKKKDAKESASEQPLQELYSDKTVWLNSSLTMSHKAVIENPRGLLDSDIIDYCLAHLKDKFRTMNGLDSCLQTGKIRDNSDFAPPAVSITNTEISEYQTHWITFSSHKPGVVKIYNSKYSTHLPPETVLAIYNATKREEGEPLEIEFVHCDQQNNDFDCAVHAIANTIALCSDIDPACLEYEGGEQMREHLIKCIEDQTFTKFPSKMSAQDSPESDYTPKYEAHCTCTDEKMRFRGNMLPVQCSLCGKQNMWSHTTCHHIKGTSEVDLTNGNTLKCKECRHKD